MDIDRILESFRKVRALVVGDVMLDNYWYGRVQRISPEAPVPVVEVTGSASMPGGAANVALNLRSLNAVVDLTGLCGQDEAGATLQNLLSHHGIGNKLLTVPDRPTTTKTRIMGNQVQMLRLDREVNTEAEPHLAARFQDHVEIIMNSASYDVVIMEDYDKGALHSALIASVVRYCRERGIPVVADPKRRHFWDFAGVTLFKPNLRELEDALQTSVSNPLKEEDVERSISLCRQRMPHHFTMLTLGARGLWLSWEEGLLKIPSRERHVRDVSGAGDTVAAVAALCLAVGLPPQVMAVLSNLAGGRVCEEPGVTAITPDMLRREAHHTCLVS